MLLFMLITSGIVMTNQGPPSAGGSVAIKCTLIGLQGWKYLLVSHERTGYPINQVLNVTSHGDTIFPKNKDFKYIDRLLVSLSIGHTSASVFINFTSMNCRDEGTYTCNAFGGPQPISGKGYLFVKGR